MTTSPRGINIIPESDIYRLVMRSDIEAAEQFQDWVGEVLSTIRKTGGTYMTDDALMKTLEDDA